RVAREQRSQILLKKCCIHNSKETTGAQLVGITQIRWNRYGDSLSYRWRSQKHVVAERETRQAPELCALQGITVLCGAEVYGPGLVIGRQKDWGALRGPDDGGTIQCGITRVGENEFQRHEYSWYRRCVCA